jgi:hypothetical protein
MCGRLAASALDAFVYLMGEASDQALFCDHSSSFWLLTTYSPLN